MRRYLKCQHIEFIHKTEGQPIQMHTKLRVNLYNCTETGGQPIQMHDIERLSNLKLIYRQLFEMPTQP